VAGRDGWPDDAAALMAEQERLAGLAPPSWRPVPAEPAVGGCFVAYLPGEAGPGRSADRAWVGAVATVAGRLVARAVVPGVAGAPYVPGLLALREGPMLAASVRALEYYGTRAVRTTNRRGDLRSRRVRLRADWTPGLRSGYVR
jgi:hypothetical protein